MTDEFIQTYDASKSNQSEIISHKISALNDVGYDFELQTVYYVHESKYLYSISMITMDKKVPKQFFSPCFLIFLIVAIIVITILKMNL